MFADKVGNDMRIVKKFLAIRLHRDIIIFKVGRETML